MTGCNAVVRADASVTIGGGHIRRCLSLADALAAAGWDVVFATLPETTETMPALARAGYRCLALLPQQDEAAQLRAHVPEGCTVLIVDHYSRGAEFERGCRGWASQILAIDDLRRSHDCDMLLDQTPGRVPSDYAGLVPAGCRVLAGAGYALLDRRFRASRRQRGEEPGAIRRVLVSFGWSDPVGATALAIEALIRAGLGVEVDVVLGANSRSLDRARQLIGALQPEAHMLTAVDDMAGLLAVADLAVGAGGTSALERCCVGLPSIIVPIADNQRDNAASLSQLGAGQVLRPALSLGVDELAAAIRELAGDRARRQAISAAGRDLCDGWGAARVAAQIVALGGASPARGEGAPAGLVIRSALPEDAGSVWTWRNDPAARAMSANEQAIPWAAHRAWFEERLASPDTIMLIGSVDDEAIGVLRFDRSGDTAEVSIAVAAERRGQGWGRLLLRQGCEMIERQGFARALEARIKPENKGSQRLFAAAGFRRYEAGALERYRRAPSPDAAVPSGQSPQPPARRAG
ncbi:MAG TPA: UDP-2,4-diacetamido-2,4,6-trideoxy-beta-L-altropyranose hydrolase [Stellaceae bacterium]|nr:UDP-2,4-diacetamido-2,4,6-trideoxy-beta-L-altropyranose hydrolase [Stellaceae bacterium]